MAPHPVAAFIDPGPADLVHEPELGDGHDHLLVVWTSGRQAMGATVGQNGQLDMIGYGDCNIYS